MLSEFQKIRLQQLVLTKPDQYLEVLRLDEMHPVVSGNKFFKLRYYLEEAVQTSKRIITFGGAYSNHLVATAYACQKAGVSCLGIVRGEASPELSHTLQQCIAYGMELQFVSRDTYRHLQNSDQLQQQYQSAIIVPEGGYGINGARGAATIGHCLDPATTHLCCAIGTATMAAGLLLQAAPHQTIIGIPVLKGMNDIHERLTQLAVPPQQQLQLYVADGYHFGGYAKKTPQLLRFMNTVFQEHALPTDFVYTAKLMYAVFDLLQQDFFPAASRITCIHSGGLQGNLSLPAGTLTF